MKTYESSMKEMEGQFPTKILKCPFFGCELGHLTVSLTSYLKKISCKAPKLCNFIALTSLGLEKRTS